MNLKTKIGVVSMVSMNLSGVVVGSAIAAIGQSFPDLPISTVQLLTTLPGLGSLLITLIAGQLALKISKKTLSLLGIALITLGGLLSSFSNSSITVMML
ncbi:MFS transporter [Streptococcus sp. S784/96/1]|uniref:MFS transporter n=1 Tax=Streptococcus sp. S784/96/1 TaxID=2653499 RepID=UPI001389887D|nr:MFS transporter [Streptococcus sp. S784/96/1]